LKNIDKNSPTSVVLSLIEKINFKYPRRFALNKIEKGSHLFMNPIVACIETNKSLESWGRFSVFLARLAI